MKKTQHERDLARLKTAVANAQANVTRREIELRVANNELTRAKGELDALFMTAARAEAAQKRLEAGEPNALHLVSAGANKIQVIKAIRELTYLGLKEAKDIADAAGLYRGVNVIGPFDVARLETAERMIRDAGGTVDRVVV